MSKSTIFTFCAHERGLLKNIGKLPEQAIDDLEKAVAVQRLHLDHNRTYPTAKEEREFRDKLQKTILSLLEQLNALPPRIERRILQKETLLNALQEANVALDKLPERFDTAGNKESDRKGLVFSVASIFLRHGIEPKRYGTRFRGVLAIIYSAIGEDQSSARNDIEKDEHWDAIQQLIDYPDGMPDPD